MVARLAMYKNDPGPLHLLVKRKGGINECAARWSRWLRKRTQDVGRCTWCETSMPAGYAKGPVCNLRDRECPSLSARRRQSHAGRMPKLRRPAKTKLSRREFLPDVLLFQLVRNLFETRLGTRLIFLAPPARQARRWHQSYPR